MKVCHIVSTFPRSEDDPQVPWLVEALRRLQARGVQIEVLAPSYKGLGDQVLFGIPVRRFRYFPSRWEDLTHDEGAPNKIAGLRFKAASVCYVAAGLLAAVRLCRRARFDVIHVHWPFPHGLFGWAGARASGARIILHFYGAELLLARTYGFVAPALRWCCRRADRVLAISSFTANTVRALTGCNDVTVIPYGWAVKEGAEDRGRGRGAIAEQEDTMAGRADEETQAERGGETQRGGRASGWGEHEGTGERQEVAGIRGSREKGPGRRSADGGFVNASSLSAGSVEPCSRDLQALSEGGRPGINGAVAQEAGGAAVGECTAGGASGDATDEPGRLSSGRNGGGTRRLVLFVGRLVERKGVEYLVRAFGLLRRQGRTDLRLVIVGAGHRRAVLERIMAEEELGDTVLLAGRLTEDELAAYYQRCDVFVLPAIVDSRGDTEGQGVVLLEAMRQKKPVIASAVGGIVDIVKDGETGLLVPEKDPTALASAILRVVDHPDLARRLGECGYRHACEQFDWEKITDQFEEVYRDVA